MQVLIIGERYIGEALSLAIRRCAFLYQEFMNFIYEDGLSPRHEEISDYLITLDLSDHADFLKNNVYTVGLILFILDPSFSVTNTIQKIRMGQLNIPNNLPIVLLTMSKIDYCQKTVLPLWHLKKKKLILRIPFTLEKLAGMISRAYPLDEVDLRYVGNLMLPSILRDIRHSVTDSNYKEKKEILMDILPEDMKECLYPLEGMDRVRNAIGKIISVLERTINDR